MKAIERPAGHRIGYVRVSSKDQNPERQLQALGQLDRKPFLDYASGKNTARPELELMLDHVRDGDTLVVHSMDRLARNVEDLLRLVGSLTDKGVHVEFVKENLKFTGDDDKYSRLMLTMLGAVADLERSWINERQAEGIAIAKADGRYKGGAKKLRPEQVQAARERLASGVAHAVVARDLGVSRQSLYTYLKA